MCELKISPGRTVAVAQRMTSSGNSFDAALGAALLHGTFRDQRKIIVSFERVIQKYMY